MRAEQLLEKCRKTLAEKLGVVPIDLDLLHAIVSAHAASFADRDGALVAASDPAELDHLKRHFLTGFYGIAAGPRLDEAVAATGRRLSKAGATPYTAVFLYLVLQHLEHPAAAPRISLALAATDAPSFEALLAVVKGVAAPPTSFFQQQIATAMKLASQGVHAAFYADQAPVPWLSTDADRYADAFAALAVNQAAYILSLTTLRDFDKTVQGASFDTVAARIAALSPRAGRAMFVDYMKDPARLGFCFQDPARWAACIAQKAAAKDFLEALVLELQSGDQSASVLPAKVLLVVLEALDAAGPNLQAVVAAWQQSEHWGLVSDYGSVPWFDTAQIAFQQGQAWYGTLSQGIAQACSATQRESFTKQVVNPLDTSDWAVDQSWIRTTYGDGVVSWLDSPEGPASLGMRSGDGPSNVDEELDDSDFFAAEPAASGITLPRLVTRPLEPARPLPSGFGELSVLDGHLWIDGALVDSHVQGDHIYWTRSRADGAVEHGFLELAPDRTHGTGRVRVGDEVIGFAAFTDIDYATRYGGGATPWYTFVMGFKVNDKGQNVPFGELNGFSGKQPTTLFSSTDGALAADIELDPLWAAWNNGEWIAAEITFSADYRTFTGNLYPYDASQSQNRGTALPLTGTCSNWQVLQQYRAALAASPVARTPGVALLATAPGEDAVPPRFAAAVALASDTPLTVERLFSLPPPDAEILHQTIFGTLKNLMLYSLPEDQLSWFGEARPQVGPGGPLSQAEVDLLGDTDVKKFFTDQFALGYLAQAFSTSSDPKIKDAYGTVPDYVDRLAFFWQGTGNTCFPRQRGYNVAASRVMDLTYASMVPGLGPYLTDAVDWAKQLYDYSTQPTVLTGLALQSTMDQQSRLRNLAMLLHALDPSAAAMSASGKPVSYATALYEKVIDARLNNVRQQFTVAGSQEDAVEFLTEFLTQYFQQIQDGTGPWSEELRQAALADLEAAQQELGVDTVNAVVAHSGDAIASLVDLLVAFSNSTNPVSKRLNQWAKDNPKIAGRLGAAFTMAAGAFVATALVEAILNWNELTPVDKGQVVINSVAYAAKAFDNVAKYQAAKTLTNSEAAPDQAFDGAQTVEEALGEEGMVVSLGDALAVAAAPAAGDLTAPLLAEAGGAAGDALSTAGGLAAATSRWTKISKVAGGFAEAMGIVAMAAACVATAFQIAEDFKSGQPTAVKVLDICEEVANGVCFLVSAGVGIAALCGIEVLAFIPVVGAVAAILGVVIAVVLLFLHRNPPPSPIEEFVENTCVPFLQKLAAAPQAWLDAREGAQNHLQGTAP